MAQITKINYRALSVNTVLFLMTFYFIFHAFSGDRGVFAYMKLSAKLKEQTLTLTELTSQRYALQRKVDLLHPKNLDLDLLDEIARRDLGLISQTEKVMYLGE
ncbi:MAG: FtsB family cell division protein [Alphaproteobacteria bacterium]|jgi:cell division protein FtsB|nr:septum formation initiator family protein [Candidatus Jidaibacter sp.]